MREWQQAELAATHAILLPKVAPPLKVPHESPHSSNTVNARYLGKNGGLARGALPMSFGFRIPFDIPCQIIK
jgi:hypothetical protein